MDSTSKITEKVAGGGLLGGQIKIWKFSFFPP